jgi:hypothetical protein
MTLAELIRGTVENLRVATATVATTATLEGEEGRTVAKVAGVAVANPTNAKITEQAEDLAEHFNERAAILEHDANLSRETAEIEAAKMTATLARNKGYQWAALRLAFASYPSILAKLPDRPGVVDTLPLGVAKLAIHPRHGVMPQGAHRAPERAA